MQEEVAMGLLEEGVSSFDRVRVTPLDVFGEVQGGPREHPANLGQFAHVMDEPPPRDGSLRLPNQRLFQRVPEAHGCGGEIYFSSCDLDALCVAMRLMGIGMRHVRAGEEHRYAVFCRQAAHPAREGFLAEMRIIMPGMFAGYYQIKPEDEGIQLAQEISVEEAIIAFLKAEDERWHGPPGFGSRLPLRGLLGGDGEFSHEELAFAVGVENPAGIFRVRSWVWLRMYED